MGGRPQSAEMFRQPIRRVDFMVKTAAEKTSNGSFQQQQATGHGLLEGYDIIAEQPFDLFHYFVAGSHQ